MEKYKQVCTKETILAEIQKYLVSIRTTATKQIKVSSSRWESIKKVSEEVAIVGLQKEHSKYETNSLEIFRNRNRKQSRLKLIKYSKIITIITTTTIGQLQTKKRFLLKYKSINQDNSYNLTFHLFCRTKQIKSLIQSMSKYQKVSEEVAIVGLQKEH